MDHVVYLDAKAGELERILHGEQQMIIRGAAGRKMPFDRVHAGDRLFFLQNNGEGLVRAQAAASEVLQFGPLKPDDCAAVLERYQAALRLTPGQYQRWAGKRYLVLVRLGEVSPLEPFGIDRSGYGNMDDWLPVGQIDLVRLSAGQGSAE